MRLRLPESRGRVEICGYWVGVQHDETYGALTKGMTTSKWYVIGYSYSWGRNYQNEGALDLLGLITALENFFVYVDLNL